jgi:DNA-binding NarL/FixJ family response regulator
VTERTVETHTGRIFAKLGLDSDPATHRRVLAVPARLRASATPLT